MGVPQELDGFEGKISLKWMIWGIPPYETTISGDLMFGTWDIDSFVGIELENSCRPHESDP